MRDADELRFLVEDALAELTFSAPAELAGALRYSLDGGGKRIRPVLCLAVGEVLGREPEELMPAACAVELVHTFSLVHDDLPSLDDDDTRRGRPSTWAQFGEAVAVLGGDALLVEAFRLALTYDDPAVARELVDATLGMIGGQYLDVTDSEVDLAALNRQKTGRLFEASVLVAVAVAGSDREAWRVFAQEVGSLFQLVDDLLDGDGFVTVYGAEEARRRADQAAGRAHDTLAELDLDTSVLADLVDSLATRSA